MTHQLKILPKYFCRVEDGSKTFEFRNNDRGFQSGDNVILNEWTEEDSYSGRMAEFRIGYILPLENNHVVFSLLTKSL